MAPMAENPIVLPAVSAGWAVTATVARSAATAIKWDCIEYMPGILSVD